MADSVKLRVQCGGLTARTWRRAEKSANGDDERKREQREVSQGRKAEGRERVCESQAVGNNLASVPIAYRLAYTAHEARSVTHKRLMLTA